MALMTNDLRQLARAVELARSCRSKIIQNVVLSVGSKLLVLVLAFVGYAALWLAVVADVGTCVVVILNSLRVLGKAKAAPGGVHCVAESFGGGCCEDKAGCAAGGGSGRGSTCCSKEQGAGGTCGVNGAGGAESAKKGACCGAEEKKCAKDEDKKHHTHDHKHARKHEHKHAEDHKHSHGASCSHGHAKSAPHSHSHGHSHAEAHLHAGGHSHASGHSHAEAHSHSHGHSHEHKSSSIWKPACLSGHAHVDKEEASAACCGPENAVAPVKQQAGTAGKECCSGGGCKKRALALADVKRVSEARTAGTPKTCCAAKKCGAEGVPAVVTIEEGSAVDRGRGDLKLSGLVSADVKQAREPGTQKPCCASKKCGAGGVPAVVTVEEGSAVDIGRGDSKLC
jgi:hypothetical protein